MSKDNKPTAELSKTYTPERMVKFMSHLIRKPVNHGFWVLPAHMSPKDK